MDLRDLAGILLRRWYVVVVALAAAAAAFLALLSDGGVYASKPVVAFMLPGAQSTDPDNGVNLDALILFATTVAETVNNGRPVARYAAEDAPAYGAGDTEQIRVAVPSVGGQWSTAFARAEVAISIVGPTEEWVKARQQELIDAVFDAADGQQGLRSVPEDQRIEALLLPLSMNIEYVASTRWQQIVAAAALGVAAVIVGGWLALLLDRAVKSRRERGRSRTGSGDGRAVPAEPMGVR
ncbi:hypothetical protein [Microbacterium yannicii]|uniref:hypothetical protein n=1 Tax=Microbacterium yannicii TaxID=671622 RepID=UPI00030E01A1|nr:hypothetical protein [Microbacterium yannicii]